MKLRNFKYILLLALIAQTQLYSHGHQEPEKEESIRSNTQQQMIANFFNIVIQALLIANSEKKEDQIQAAANAINSISNITQLTVRASSLDTLDHNNELLNYVTTHHEELMAYIERVMDSERPTSTNN